MGGAELRWIEHLPGKKPGRAVPVALAQHALAQQPESAALRLILARACLAIEDFAAAAEQFAWLGARDPAFPGAADLARCQIRLGRFDDALVTCDRSIVAGGDTAQVRLRKGEALRRLGRPDEARIAFEACVALGDHNYQGMSALLRPLARLADGGPLLACCDALPPRSAATGLARANRAIALSRLGRAGEARAMIDLDAHIVRVPIDPPPRFATIAAFNAALARESLDAQLRGGPPPDADIDYSPETDGRPLLVALLRPIRTALEEYVARIPALGLESAFPTLPRTAHMHHGVTILREGGANGQHVHISADICSVYHVQVPAEVANAADGRGALTLGGCETYTGGYSPCWGTREIRPEPGWLTLFPAHVFHDVIPTRSREPRISIPADLLRVA